MPPSASRFRPVAVTTTSASSSAPEREAQPALGEGVDPVGDDRRAPRRRRLEQVAVGHEAHALVPRVVPRLEVRVDVVAGRQLRRDALADERLGPARGARRLSWKNSVVTSDVLPAHERVRGPGGQRAAREVGHRVAGRAATRRSWASAAASSRARPARPAPGRASRPSRRCRSRRRACPRSRGPPASAAGARPGRRSARCPGTPACSPRRSGSSRCSAKRKPQVSRTASPVSVRSASTVQRASALDHSARTTRWPKRMASSTPWSRAVVARCSAGSTAPSAIAFASFHGRKR